MEVDGKREEKRRVLGMCVFFVLWSSPHSASATEYYCVCVCVYACMCVCILCMHTGIPGCVQAHISTYSRGWPSYMTTKLKAPLNYILESWRYEDIKEWNWLTQRAFFTSNMVPPRVTINDQNTRPSFHFEAYNPKMVQIVWQELSLRTLFELARCLSSYPIPIQLRQ